MGTTVPMRNRLWKELVLVEHVYVQIRAAQYVFQLPSPAEIQFWHSNKICCENDMSCVLISGMKMCTLNEDMYVCMLVS